MDRRKFIIEAGKAFPIVAGAMYVVGCDSNYDDDTNSDDNNDGGNNGGNRVVTLSAVSTIVAGHSHSAAIPIDDLDSATSKSYPSSNSVGHVHTVTLSASQLGTISMGRSVTVGSSSSADHAHQFTFSLTNNDPIDSIDPPY